MFEIWIINYDETEFILQNDSNEEFLGNTMLSCTFLHKNYQTVILSNKLQEDIFYLADI